MHPVTHVASEQQRSMTLLCCVQGVIVNMNAHNIGPQQPTAAPQDETDTHLHDQPAPDVISSAPNTSFTPSSSQTVHNSHSSATAGNAADNQVVAIASTQPQAHYPSSAEATQEPSSSAVGTSAASSQPYSHQPPVSDPLGAPSSTTSADQPALHANVDEQSQEGARQRQQAAEDAAQATMHTQSSSQQHPQQTGSQTQPSEIHASYEDKGFVPSTAHHQSQSTTSAGPTHSQSDAEHSPHDSPPSIKHFGSGALSRLDALGGDEPTSSDNVASQGAQPQPEAQQSSQTETASHAEGQAASQDPAHTSDIPPDATDSQANAADYRASEPSAEGVNQASPSNQEAADQASQPAREGAAQPVATAEQASVSGRDTTAQPVAAGEQESITGRGAAAEQESGRDSTAHPAGPAGESCQIMHHLLPMTQATCLHRLSKQTAAQILGNCVSYVA